MTPRQKEFCRHYVSGLPASKAATAAGYAQTTAERNAAHFLEHPAIAARIARLRTQRCIVNLSDLQNSRERITRLIETTSDLSLLIKANQELCRLARLQYKLPLDEYTTLKEEQHEADINLANLENTYEDLANPDFTQTPDEIHKIEAQLLDIEGEQVDEKNFSQPKYFDHTPTGHLAFDQPKHILFESSSPKAALLEGPPSVQGLPALNDREAGVHACIESQTAQPNRLNPQAQALQPSVADTRTPASPIIVITSQTSLPTPPPKSTYSTE